MKDPRDIIRRPVVTEKTTDLMEDNKYVFEVDLKANKTEIKNAVEKIFDVKVAQVNTMRVKGSRSASAVTPVALQTGKSDCQVDRRQQEHRAL